jgi:hypothetical protein
MSTKEPCNKVGENVLVNRVMGRWKDMAMRELLEHSGIVMSFFSIRETSSTPDCRHEGKIEVEEQVEAAFRVPDVVMLDAPPKPYCRRVRILTPSSLKEE